MIHEMIKPSYIQFDVDADNWQDAIVKAAQPLIDDEAIKPSYVDGIIKTAKEFGPYFVITKGVALPHCSNDGNVLENSLSVSVLKKPVFFGSEANDPVKFIFLLAPKNTNDHLNSLSQLASLLSTEEFYSILANSTNSVEVMNFIVEREGD